MSAEIETLKENAKRCQQELRGQHSELLRTQELLALHIEDAKMIAYNASIEAAGAGEFGGRFEVVAREMRRVADGLSNSSVQLKIVLIEIDRTLDKQQSELLED